MGSRRGQERASLDYAAERLPDLEVHVGGTTSVDVTEAGIDKAYGMRKLMTVLDLTSDEILFLGDKLDEGRNDYRDKAIRNRRHRREGLGRNCAGVQAIIEVSQWSKASPIDGGRAPRASLG